MDGKHKYKLSIMACFFLNVVTIGFAIILVVQGIISQLSDSIIVAFGMYLIAVLLITISYFVYKRASHMLRILGPD